MKRFLFKVYFADMVSVSTEIVRPEGNPDIAAHAALMILAFSLTVTMGMPARESLTWIETSRKSQSS